ncbi:uncharacterized protein LOC119665511 [Teleopsis dalmanni]|uniref:uncharacterized protein LOC119665511 n=2 Tax=Teleopsis dalmanni TaxID=139649 RepID=UPI0018CD31C7|nr:uncharacterized protein LOC119665511 [Teleopsis dalmanni]
MEHFNTLIDQQQAIGAEIERIISNFKKDPASRKTNRYYQDRILRLTEQWSRLEKNHNTLLSCKAMAEDTEDEYFTTGYYERMTELTNKYLGIFNKALIEMQEVENAQEKPPRQHNQNPMQLQQNEELSRVLRNQRALINVIDRSSQEIEMASQESQNEVFYSCKLALIEGYHKAFDNNNEKIWNSTLEEFIEGYSWELYYEISQKLQDMEICLKLKLKSFNSHYQHDSTIQAVKLPQLTIPIFDGNQLKWVEFRDLFTQLIDEQPFKPIQKMFYLTTNLIGEPKNLIKHLPASAENYITAWEILKARYNNGRLLVTALLNKLFALPAMTTETASGLKTLHDISQECLLGLKAQNIPVEHWDVIIVHMTLKKLDKITQTAFEQSLSNNRELITMKELFQFIEQRFQSLETINNSASIKKWVKTVATTNTAPVKCPICKRDNHPIHLCKQFLDDTPAKRLHLIKSLQRCFNCLKNGHFTKDCTSGSCLKCSKKHNTLLHLEGTLEASMIKKASLSKNPASLFSNNLNIQKNYVVLGTARVVVKGNNGREIECRALLDSGSQVNLITDQIIKKLGENPKKTSACIEGVGQKKQDAQQRINLAFSSRINGFSSRIEAYVLPKIVCDQPSIHIESSSWKIPQNINLADPSFSTPNKIDLLLGAEFSHQLLSIGQINLGRGLPILQNTLLGWLVVGKISNQNSIISPQVCGICSEDEQDTMKVIERFWQLDEPEKANKNLSPSEELCESHFATYMKRNQDGQFSVRLPFKQDPSLLGESKHIAINRFLALERRLDKDVILKTQYVQFMNEYADLGHMERVDINQVNPHYVIPHHGVLRPDSSTTKLRVVFDASCKTSSGLSLNDTMFTGPTIQEELFAILLRFRCPRFVFCSDIQKMYRQIIIQPEDQRYQLIVWRSNNNEPLQFYRLKTVTYGTRSAPYLATKCLQQLAKSELQKYPLGAAALSNDFYVDDCLSGSNSLQTAKDIQTQLKGLLESAGFKLSKWCANHPSLLQNIAKEDQEVDLDFQSDDATSIKTLGLTWQPKEDQFRIKLKLDPLKIITKRTITSNLAKIFDPLGLLGPVLVTAKILIQDLWQLQLTWDEAVPTEIYTRWTTFYDDLQVLDQFKIDRHIFGKQMPALESIQLHVFCDASQKAYGAAVYVRAKLMDGRLINRLLCSKSRVAPLKKQTIPRLELCSALLGATLMKKVKNNINHDVATYYWTDSEIVLFWINSSSARHQQFIANRINAIQEISLPNQWRHVRSKDNPADSLSRGIKPAQLLENNLWLYGPLFLHGSESNWPGEFNKTLCIDPVNPEWKQTTREVALISTDYDIHWIDRINHRNSFRTLLHTVGYMLRFVNRARRTNLSNITMALSPMELELSLRHIVKYIQQSELKEELNQLERNQTVKPASTLAGLMPFLDEHKIIRVGGRSEASSLTYDESTR